MSQPFFVAEVFTGRPGEYVSIKDTVASFKEILEGNTDTLPGAGLLPGRHHRRRPRERRQAGELTDAPHRSRSSRRSGSPTRTRSIRSSCPASTASSGCCPTTRRSCRCWASGELRIRKGGSEESFAIVGGFLQVRPDKVVVMAETADLASEIDLEKAQEARREAERALETGYTEGADLSTARAALQQALLRIRVAERRHREGPRRRG